MSLSRGDTQTAGPGRLTEEETIGEDAQVLQVSQVDAIVMIDNPIGEGPGTGATAGIAILPGATTDETGGTRTNAEGRLRLLETEETT